MQRWGWVGELPPPSPPAPAARQYTVAEPLGQGSFGAVWRAWDANGASVAVKEIACGSEAECGKPWGVKLLDLDRLSLSLSLS